MYIGRDLTMASSLTPCSRQRLLGEGRSGQWKSWHSTCWRHGRDFLNSSWCYFGSPLCFWYIILQSELSEAFWWGVKTLVEYSLMERESMCCTLQCYSHSYVLPGQLFHGKRMGLSHPSSSAMEWLQAVRVRDLLQTPLETNSTLILVLLKNWQQAKPSSLIIFPI